MFTILQINGRYRKTLYRPLFIIGGKMKNYPLASVSEESVVVDVADVVPVGKKFLSS